MEVKNDDGKEGGGVKAVTLSGYAQFLSFLEFNFLYGR